MKKAITLTTAALLVAPALSVTTLAWAEPMARGAEAEVEIQRVNADGVGEAIGTIWVAEHKDGVLFDPDLEGLEPGLHGFHLHQNPDCSPAEKDGKTTPAGAAGGHYNPDGEGEHKGPYEAGHRGDLPPLFVDAGGNASIPVLAPRLSFNEVNGRALIIHQGGDNYSDDPKPLGGGGARVACGVVSIE